MATELKQSTQVNIKMGPFLDEDDQKSTEEGLTISQADVRLSKNGGAFASKADDGGNAHDENGWYIIGLNDADTNTLGTLVVAIHEAGALPKDREFMVVKSNEFNTRYSTDTYDVQVTGIGPAVITATSIASNAFTADEFAASAITKIQGRFVLVDTTIATLASQTSFTLTAGSANNNAYNECVAIIEDATTAAQKAVGFISDYAGGSKTVTLEADPGIFTMQATDKITIVALPTPLGGSKSVWDRLLSGATHNINTSAGKRLRQIQENLGYANGAVWVDTINGSGGTENFENGTTGNKSNDIEDAKTIADSLGLNIFEISPSSDLTLHESFDNFVLTGSHWILALNSKSISETVIRGAEITGTATAADSPHISESDIGDTTLPACHLHACSISGAITLADAGDYFLDQCYSGIAGTATPSIDFQAGVGSTNLNMRHYSGGIEIKNMGGAGTDNMSLEGNGQLIINANCSGGTIAIRGNFTVTDNASGAVTLSDDARYDIDQPWTSKTVTVGGTRTAGTVVTLIAGFALGDKSVAAGVTTIKDIDDGSDLATYVVDATGTILNVTIL